MATEIHLCARCAAQGKTCCQGKDRDIYITTGDLKRIGDYVASQDFFEFRRPTDSAYSGQDNDPLWTTHVFRPDGTRRVLKRNEDFEDCVFLTVKGCLLPIVIRPLICRLYPYAYNAGGLCGVLSEGCPIHLLSEGHSLIQCIGMDAQVAGTWHRMLYNEILLEKADDYRIDLRPAV